MKKTSLIELGEYVSLLVLGGATEVSFKFLAGLTVLKWKFPGQPGESLSFEMEEPC